MKRCGKEKLSYRKEADMQRNKVDKMKAEGREEIEIRKMNEVALSYLLGSFACEVITVSPLLIM